MLTETISGSITSYRRVCTTYFREGELIQSSLRKVSRSQYVSSRDAAQKQRSKAQFGLFVVPRNSPKGLLFPLPDRTLVWCAAGRSGLARRRHHATQAETETRTQKGAAPDRPGPRQARGFAHAGVGRVSPFLLVRRRGLHRMVFFGAAPGLQQAGCAAIPNRT